jgi:suppressor of ftsI
VWLVVGDRPGFSQSSGLLDNIPPMNTIKAALSMWRLRDSRWARRLLAIQLTCLAPVVHGLGSSTPMPGSATVSNLTGNGNCEQTTLVAAPQTLDLGAVQISALTYNNNYAGPLLRVRPGDTLCVRLVNHLAQNTNLHFHGILASPLGRSDNMMIEVAPGDSFDYVVKVPKWQTPGLYWYHTHVHGLTEQAVLHGLSGPLLVEGSEDRFLEPHAFKQQLLVLKEYHESTSRDRTLREQFNGRLFTINGQVEPALRLRPEEWQLWHLGNFGPNRPFQLAIQGHTMVVVGRDGVPVLHPYTVGDLTVDPGSRYEVLIKGNQAGMYPIFASDDDGDGRGGGRRKGRSTSTASQQFHIGTLEVVGEPATSIRMPQPRTAGEEDLATAHIDAFRTIVFGQQGQQYTINGATFDHSRVDTRVPLGNIEQWTIQNASGEMHVFHIHQVNFQVMDRNGTPESFNGNVDTVRIPPRQSVTVRIAFTHPEILGRFMYHCHVMQHEDRGMMAQIEVYDPRLPSPMSVPRVTTMTGMQPEH